MLFCKLGYVNTPLLIFSNLLITISFIEHVRKVTAAILVFILNFTTTISSIINSQFFVNLFRIALRWNTQTQSQGNCRHNLSSSIIWHKYLLGTLGDTFDKIGNSTCYILGHFNMNTLNITQQIPINVIRHFQNLAFSSEF